MPEQLVILGVALLFLLGIGGLISIFNVTFEHFWPTRYDPKGWPEAARWLGGTYRRRGAVRDHAIEVRSGPLTLRVQSFRYTVGERQETGTRFSASGDGLFPPGLILRKQATVAGNVLSVFRGADLQVGDRVFDEWVDVRGRLTGVLAVLDHETRPLVVDILERGARISDDAIVWDVKEDVSKASEVFRHATRILEVARRLQDPGQRIPEQLARNAAKDRVPSVRLENLLALQDEYPDTALAREASVAGLEDSFPHLRLAGALFLGSDGHAAILHIVGDPHADDGIRIEAMQRLPQDVPRAEAIRILGRILAEEKSDLQNEAIAACGRLRLTAMAPAILSLLARPSLPSAIFAAEALGEVGDSSAESALLELLRSDETEVATVAARALGRVATVAAVQPLLDRAKGVLTSSSLRSAALEAVGAIQSRVSGAERGQLAIEAAAAASGQVSLADAPAGGRVSLAQPSREEEEDS